METRRKKLIALAALGSVWGSLLLWQWGSWEEPVRVPLANVSGAAAPAKRAGTDNLHVQLDLLAAARTQRQMTFATPRNIFAMPSVGPINASAPSEVPDTALQQQVIATELAQFHYLGFVRTGEEWQKKQEMAVLTKNDDLHVVKAGETIDQHVVVKTITQDSVTLLDRDSRVEYTVLLSEEPQAPAP
ncbi:MAG TPA: hypothetical protein VL261_11400 [Nitrospira sp.]|jgi:hypothetical protein|nr:hypothetical protein [Nitrospira sp.]